MMHSQSFAAVFAILVAANTIGAAPAALESRRVCKTHPTIDANFDDQNYALGSLLPELVPVGTYKGLTYNSFVGVQATTDTGIQPHSSPNEIITALPSDLVDGTAYIEASGSTTYFDFHSFYFGCTVDSAAGLIGIDTSCTVTATGYYEGKQLAVQEFNFEPTGLLESSQDKASVQKAACHTDFTGVDKVEFTSSNPVLLAVVIDDISYTPHSCSN